MKSIQRGLCLYLVESSVWPLIDIYEKGNELIVEIDLPGIEPDDVSIRVYGDLLIIEGIGNDSGREPNLRYICMERGIRGFRRVLKFPVPVNASSSEAFYARGVISIRFPKLESRAITITVKRSAE
ncbi:MAG TPA: Hsp20/alpha crystallin family protein [Dissulfurispiraceae bacterium]|nr:Hsp20/alpha crystallin family protein [Dissulfurispiraceae bacterium]